MYLKINLNKLSNDIDIIDLAIINFCVELKHRRIIRPVLARTLKLSDITIKRRVKDLVEKGLLNKNLYPTEKGFELSSIDYRQDSFEKRNIGQDKKKSKLEILFESVYSKTKN